MQEREQVIEGFRLSPQQKQIWELQKDGEAYHSQVAVLIEGDFESRALDEALKKIRRKHEILRTTLDWLPGLDTPFQMILEDSGLACRKINISDRSREEREGAVEEVLREEARPFELKRGQLMRSGLVRISASRRILVISLHALCADSWTLRNLFREVSRFYAAELEGRELAEEAVQYLQFSEWQNELLEELNEEIEGREQEADRPDPDLILPLEFDPAGASKLQRHHFAPEFIALRFDWPMARRIEAVSNDCHSPVSGFLLACWQILLWRLSAKVEILTEYLFDGRPFEKLHDALGLFAGYVPVRGTFGHDPSFDEAVERALKSIDQAFEAPEFSIREMASGRARNRVQAIGFEYEEWPEPQSAGAAKFTYWRQRSCIGRFKLKLGIYRTANGLTVELQYDSALFSRESVGLIGERYLRLVESAASDRKALIRDLQIIGRGELERLLDAWNKTEQQLTVLRPIHDLIGEQARLRPESIAVIYRDEQVCYLEFEIRANRLAHHLRAQGVGPDCVVGLYLARSTEMMVGLFGILKAGGAYLPLEIGLPAERLGTMLEDSGARIVITKQDMESSLPPGRYRTVLLDGEWERLAEYSQSAPELELSLENLAYVIYTSGSTGKPKGVMVRHGSVVNLLEGLERAIYEGEGEDLTVSVNASLSFDASVKQLIQLGRGRRLLIVPEAERLDAESMLEYLKINRVDALDCTPSQWGALLEAGLRRGDGNPKIVLVGGEAIDSRDWREMAESRGVKYHNVYGPTECTVDAMTCVVSEMREPSIGRPISNTSIYILDENGGVAPVGMVGELCIGGAGLARGYIREAGMTAEKFVPSPYGKRGGARLYRTGDLGRYLEDGRIIYEGRRDDQVKVRGYRIELGEIEEVLKSYPWIREAVATVKVDELGQKQLVGYVVKRRERIVEAGQLEREGSSVTEPEEWITVERLKNYMREKLPHYMVPSAVMIIDSLPLTRNGKVDREALPRPEAVNRLTEIEEEIHRNAYEEVINGIWKEVLKVARIRRRDNFFEIGGHSLLATQVISRIRKAFGVEIGVRSIFEEATVEGLARKIEVAMSRGEKDKAPPMVRVSREERLPLSFAQQRLWFIDQLDPGNAVYNCPGAVKLTGELKLEVLERVINEILRRHEVLRTRINVVEGEPAQVIDEWEPRTLPVEDLTSLTPEEKEETISKMVGEDAAMGFDLRRGPLLRMKVLKLGEEEHVALFTMHHIVNDGWSMGILIGEVKALYEAYCAGEEAPLEELPIQYADFAMWQRSWIRGEVLDNQLSYWKRQLGGELPVLELPTDRPRPVRPTHRGALRSHMLSTTLSSSLKALSLRQNCTLFMTLMAAFKTLLSYLTGQTDISVGTEIANRNRAETERLIGPFANQLVLRTELSYNYTFEELLRKVREITLGAYANQDLPFEKLVETLNPRRDESRTPLFQVKMVLQNAPSEELRLPGLILSQIGIMGGTAKFDLLLFLHDTERGLSASLQYNTDLFEESTPRRILNRFHTLLDRIVERPHAKLQELIKPLIEADQAEQLEKEQELGRVRLSALKSTKRKAIGETQLKTEQ